MWVDTGGWNANIKTEGTTPPPATILVPDPLFRTALARPKRYVVGFMFSPSGSSVVLIQKNRPDWQKGKLNGVGGKIEQGETPAEAMRREFYEETGIAFNTYSWTLFATLNGPNAVVYVFRAWSDLIGNAFSKTDEEVGKYFADSLPNNILPNLKFLIPLALTPGYEHTNFHFVED